ncbi:putative helicase MOV-10 [Liolophura sinensis]|uniref:putative helicase MOV-10 n=1 Tax=Liolophura sinensis TaxID=3198878 RepID=UPI003159572A
MANRGLEESSKGLNQVEVNELKSLKSLMEKPLNEDTYDKRFAYLLNFEEIQMEVDVRKYDMEDVTMKRFPGNSKCLLLEVPGLAENRPSVLKGDWLYVRIQNGGKLGTKEYKGYVHEVQQNKVALGFHQSLLQQYVANMKFRVRFTVNRISLRLQHRAVKLAVELSLTDIISPSLKTACTQGTIIPPNEPLRFYNSKIKDNPQQMQAVQNIVAGTSRPAPYIIFGPPGTGKTVTIVEAIKQVIRCIPTAHILACAPSNSSVDVITERLLEHLPKSQVFRMLASTRPWIAVKNSIKEVCNYDKAYEQYYYPNKEEMMKYKIVLCTLVTAGRIVSANFPPDHFTHVFVDEAGCAVEPECIIPVAGVLDCLPDIKDGGQLVLTGDPEQLGPILRSPLALHYGLDISLLERYMTQCDVYARKDDGGKGQTYDPRVLTKLVNNYRSHPKLLEMPNNLFYHRELVARADPVLINAFCQWKGLPKPGFPIIFHGVEGEDMREERSPSFFNPIEASIALDYVNQLMKGESRGMKVKQSHIGVISPYRKQVQKMRKLFEKQGWKDIKVGTVEEFQGDERLIIIVSTVRCQPDWLEMDREFHLGFLDNPKRFNVAITRSRALLIVVGNPLILSKDTYWNSFFEFCHKNGGYTGMPFDDIEAFFEDILQRFNHLGLKG